MTNIRPKLLPAMLVSFACFATAPVHADPLQFTFHATVDGGPSGIASSPCIADPNPLTCAHVVPPIGVPLSIVMLLDTHLAPLAEGTSGLTGTSTKYEMTGLSSINFGYRTEFLTTSFYVRVVDDNVGLTSPDRLSIIRDEPVTATKFWFNIEFDSASTSFLSGASLPTSLDLSQTSAAGGTLFLVGGPQQFADEAHFVINSVEVSTPVPEPSSWMLLLLGLLGLVRSTPWRASMLCSL